MNWRTLADSFLSSLFEPPCAACAQVLSSPLDGAVCQRCWASIRRGALNERFAGRHAVDWACAVDHYEGRLRDIIHALKYERRRSIAKPLGGLMRESGAALLQDVDLVVPVPLHPRRLRDRGFNQAEDLARQLGLPVVGLLQRVKFTTSQIELPAEERHQNVRDAFALTGNPKGLPPQFALTGNPKGLPPQFAMTGNPEGLPPQFAMTGNPEGLPPQFAMTGNPEGLPPQFTRSLGGGNPSGLPEVVVLVDDVSTTGATLEACARVLKAAGVREVRALTAARVATGRR